MDSKPLCICTGGRSSVERQRAQLECGGPGWLEITCAYLEEHVPALGAAIADVSWTLCELFTDPPPHLAQGNNNQIAWYCTIEGPTVKFGTGVPEGVTRLR